MSLTPRFNQAANLVIEALEPKAAGLPCPPAQSARDKKPRKRKPPFGLRLTDEERARLVSDANGLPLGTYIKERLFDAGPSERKRRKGLSIQDREAFAQALALLGRTHFSSNLNQLAHAVNLGVLPVTPETESLLVESLLAVRELRRLLLTALGHGAEESP